MPDAFGNPTPLETLQTIRDKNREQFNIAQASGSPGRQLGSSLGAIFGGSLRKTLETRGARKDETIRLMRTQGLSEEAAREQAKATIGREFSQVRKAKKIEEAQTDMAAFMEDLPDELPEDQRRAAGMLFLSNRMRSMGLVTQANDMATKASIAAQAAEDRALRTRKLKADIAGSELTAEEKARALPFVGASTFMQNVIQKEQIIGKLNDPNSQLSAQDREALMRAKGHLEAKILKDETLVGRTAEDVRNDPVLMRKLFGEVADNQVLVNNIDESMAMLRDLDKLEATAFAGLGKDFLGFAERWFGRKPSETEQQFMERVQAKEGKAALVAAKVRHSLTGAQMSAFEIGFLAPFLPDPADPVSVQISKLRIVREYTQLDTDTRMQLFQQGLTETWLRSAGNGVQNNPINDELPEAAETSPNADAASADAFLDAAILKAQRGDK
jgi:hypothetical protein